MSWMDWPRKRPRIKLEVPFTEKDEAKGLGARWDRENRTWYVPRGIDPKDFKKWLPPPSLINMRADYYYILESSKACWKCGQETRVFAWMLPAGCETLEAIDDDGMEFESDEGYEVWLNSAASSEWIRRGRNVITAFVTHVPKSVGDRMRTLTNTFRPDYSKTTATRYWMNHCECCGMKQGDHAIHEEFSGPFKPMSEEEARRIRTYKVDEPFEGIGAN